MTVSTAIAMCAAALTNGAPALAAHDVAPPVVSTSVYARFVVGSTINAADYSDYESSAAITFVRQAMSFTFNDNSGRICGYEVYQLTDEGQNYPQGGNPLIEDDTYRATPYSASATLTNDDYDGQVGAGEDSVVGWTVGATDCSGNASAVHVYSQPRVIQEDGFSWAESAVGTVASKGSWSTVNCACASGHTMKKTTAKGASISYTDTYAEDGEHMAIVMAKGPGRGSAAIYVDGVRKATVNTYASTTLNRVVVFEREMAPGKHTVRVVNLATSGHARIDVDAFMTN